MELCHVKHIISKFGALMAVPAKTLYAFHRSQQLNSQDPPYRENAGLCISVKARVLF